MSVLNYTKKRITAVIEEVERLKQSEFPYDHPRDALELLKKKLEHQQAVLNKIDPSEQLDGIRPICVLTLLNLFEYVPFLGFILRSTNIRNAFEAYAPLLRLARTILGVDTKLIISSEWEYSPYVFQPAGYLPRFVLIGLPAPESTNPLLLPLAGHELGHTAWYSSEFSEDYAKQIENLVVKEITEIQWNEYQLLYPELTVDDFLNNSFYAQPVLSKTYTCALRQTEEIFCDIFGIRLFAESYLHAFEYLLSPGLPGERSALYPNMKRRASHLKEAAEEMNVKSKDDFVDCFMDGDEPQDPKAAMLAMTADAISASLLPKLLESAQILADGKSVPHVNIREVSEISNEFHGVIPITKARNLVDILNAGWQCYLEPNLWDGIPQIKQEEKDGVLKDIILKSMEVTEVYERLKATK